MRIETIMLNEERKVTLTAYVQQVDGEFLNIPRRPAILVLPGGGYSMCSEREAEPVAFAYLQAGYQAFILRYSVGEHSRWPNPLEDYEQAMKLIRSKGEDWHLYPDKVAVIGFSAGGHLAGAAATMAKNKPNAAILGYPVTEGELAKACEKTAPDLIGAVNQDTCPCFVFATRTDNVVPVSNTLRFTCALAEYGISFESHVYGFGPHGFSTANSSVMLPGTHICSRAGNWVNDSIAWLKDMFGDFGMGAMTEPKCGGRVNGDFEPYLSVDCTVGHLMANEEAQKVLAPMLQAMQKTVAEKYGDRLAKAEEQNKKADLGMGAKMTLRAALAYGNLPEQMVEQMNNALKQIPNNR